MRKYALITVAILLFTTHAADARRRRSFGTSSYSSNGTFGLGLELGSPSGLNGKYFLTQNTALNFGVGYIYDRYWYDDRDGLHLYLDHLWHPFVITQAAAFQLPFYVGVGGRVWSFNDKDDDGFAFGVRVPVGIAFDFNDVPLDVFIQITAVADFLYRHDDRFGLHLEASVGIRFWFD
jgi:hypothetical protein